MRKPVRRYLARLGLGLICTFLMSWAVVAASEYVWSRAGNLNGPPLWSFSRQSQAILVGIPFATLALLSINVWRAWISGCAVSAAIWGYYVQTTVAGYADHGIGIAMLLSPIPVLGSSLLSLLTLVDGSPVDQTINPRGR